MSSVEDTLGGHSDVCLVTKWRFRWVGSVLGIISPMLNLKTASTIATSIIVHAKLNYCNSLYLNIDVTQITASRLFSPFMSEWSRPCCYLNPQTLPDHFCSQTLDWLKIPERIQSNITHTSMLRALLPSSAVQDPTTSFNLFLWLKPNDVGPY